MLETTLACTLVNSDIKTVNPHEAITDLLGVRSAFKLPEKKLALSPLSGFFPLFHAPRPLLQWHGVLKQVWSVH